ncbi:MAG: hypothetical protein AWU55_3020 [Halomonadaceae bacterium T82-2]|nr:MAG: hypothetical protein AWU55_3020 [Halomonadaceae bacterium T82-2]
MGSTSPRACGDRVWLTGFGFSPGGLSPRLRGSDQLPQQLIANVRVIPAPAGIGWRCTTAGRGRPGYPRACGDRATSFNGADIDAGLSPRLRGSVRPAAGVGDRHRVIPAPAGIGRPPPLPPAMTAGYPRACGDRFWRTSCQTRRFGLSPRLRGSVVVVVGEIGWPRVIPAPAGIGPAAMAPRRPSTGYPRACGDRGITWVAAAMVCGLSPRLRGSGGGRRVAELADRVIPAPAGIGAAGGCSRCMLAGYPRACGDRDAKTNVETEIFGLSPRLRGSGAIPRTRLLTRRVIPAPAGIG